MPDPLSDPKIRGDRSPATRPARSGPARAERERRVVEGLRGGVAMAEIARREGITERGLRKYVRNLFARRAPEATGEFIVTQMNRLNEALTVSFGAMSPENLAAVDRVVRIVRELDRCQGFGGGARGTATRRKLLESLVSGAGAKPPQDDLRDPPADSLPDPAALAGRLSQGAGGSHADARAATPPSSRAKRGDPEAAGPNDRCSGLASRPHAVVAAPGLLRFARNDEPERAALAVTRGTGTGRNPLESPDSGAETRDPLLPASAGHASAEWRSAPD